jgi:hypothetical protein
MDIELGRAKRTFERGQDVYFMIVFEPTIKAGEAERMTTFCSTEIIMSNASL